MNGKNKLAVFDLDGTLFNTTHVNYRAYYSAMQMCGYDSQITFEYFCTYCNGRHYKKFIPDIIPHITNDELEKIHQYKQQLYTKYLRYAKKNDHLISMIRLIRADYVTAVATTASRINTMQILNFFSVVDLFDFFITQEDVEEKKPSPECYLKAMEIAGVDRTKTVIFEDSKEGFSAAEASGAACIMVYGY